jgi:hypothetical protein
MLLQLHWQFKDGTTDMKAQKEIVSNHVLQEFVEETKKSHSLPNKAIWMVCNEKSKHFVVMGSE